MKKIIALSILLLTCDLVAQAGSQCPQAAIRDQIKAVASTISGQVGVSALHVESSEHIEFNGDMLFPMASTYKIPIAIHTLALVEKGALNLETKTLLTRCDLRQDSATINTRFFQGETAISVKGLLTASLQMSDNTATDALLRLPNNTPEQITGYLQTAGIEDIMVSRTVDHMIVDFYSMPRNDTCAAIEDFNKHVDLDDLPQPRETEECFYRDTTHDSATPCAMTELLARLLKKQLISEQITTFLMDIMAGCKTGQNRIKGLLPSNTKVAHKTGTIAGIHNDAGILTLPNGEHIILTVFINGSISPRPCRDHVIASIAKLLFEYWTIKDACESN